MRKKKSKLLDLGKEIQRNSLLLASLQEETDENKRLYLQKKYELSNLKILSLRAERKGDTQ